MSDDIKTADQNPVSGIQTSPSSPVGLANKEVGPASSGVSEFAKPTDAEPRISQELKDLGIEAKKDEPNITPEHKELGVDHSGPHAPVPTSSSGNVILPMSEKEIESQLKTGQNDDSGKWYAGLLQKIIKAMGL